MFHDAKLMIYGNHQFYEILNYILATLNPDFVKLVHVVTCCTSAQVCFVDEE
jgi:hypothetical protein